MPGPLSPVSACALKELEIIGGHSSRVYDPAQLANVLTLTLEGQQTIAGEKPSLCLLVNSGSRCILSIRLCDLLPTKPPYLQAISTKTLTQQLQIDVQEQEHAVIVTFEHKREFNLAVYMLQEYGFSIKEAAMATTELGYGGSQTSTLTFENPTDFGPRLSSFTTFPGMESDAGSASQIGFSWESQWGSEIPDLHPEALSTAHHSKPSHLLQSRQSSLPSSFPSASQLHYSPYMTQLNPYNAFLGKQTYDNHRPKVSSPLRHALSPSEPLQEVMSQSLSQNSVCLPPSPSPGPSPTIEDSSPQYGNHNNYANNIDSTPTLLSQSPVLSPSFPPPPISFYRHHSDSSMERSPPNVHQFRENMPPTRSLPFVHSRKMIQSNPIDDKTPYSEEQSPNPNPPKVHGKRKRKPRDPVSRKNKSSEPPKKKPTASTSPLNQRETRSNSAAKIDISSRQNLPLKQKKQHGHSPSPIMEASINISEEKTKLSPTNTEAVNKSKQKTKNKPKTRSRTSIRGKAPNAVGDNPGIEMISPMKTNPKSISKLQIKEPEKKKKEDDKNTSLKTGSESEAHHIPDVQDSKQRRKSARLIMKSRLRNDNSAADSTQKSNSKLTDPEVNPEPDISKRGLTSGTNIKKQRRSPNELQPASPSVCLFPKSHVAILVTDEMMRQVNELTSDLLDQFGADLKEGRDDATLAQYYLDQIMEIRKTFWQSEMAKTSHNAYTTAF